MAARLLPMLAGGDGGRAVVAVELWLVGWVVWRAGGWVGKNQTGRLFSN